MNTFSVEYFDEFLYLPSEEVRMFKVTRNPVRAMTLSSDTDAINRVGMPDWKPIPESDRRIAPGTKTAAETADKMNLQ